MSKIYSKRVDVQAISRGNFNTQNGKHVKVNTLTNRPALDDIGNKLNLGNKNNILKKTNISRFDDSKTVNVKDQPINKKNIVKIDSFRKIEKKNNENKKLPSVVIERDYSNNVENVAKNVERTAHTSNKHIGILDTDESDPFLVSEYIQDIFKYLFFLENKYIITKNFLDSHSSTPRMRSILINWMVEVHLNFHFLTETLHLSVAIIDRYLQINRSVGRETLQLVGISALLIASKYEEMYIPCVSDYVYVCDDTFTCKQIFKMEIEILNKLNFDLGRPTALHFLRRFSRIANIKPQYYCLGKYLLELALNEYELCHVKPSLQAAAACCLSISILNEIQDPSQVWTETLVNHSTYKYNDIEQTVLTYANILSKIETSKYQAIRKKYASSSNNKISLNSKLKTFHI